MKTCRILILALLGAALVFAVGCKHDKTGSLTIQINAKYGAQNVKLNDTTLTPDPLNRRMQFNTLKFYLSHITLVKTDNSEVEVKDAAIFDMNNPALTSITINKLSGDYKGIKFGCGLDSAQNATNPADATGALIGDNGMYWGWLTLYQFEIFEARMDTIPGDVSALPGFFPQYHIGGNEYYRHTQLTNNFSVGEGNTTTLNINLDIKKIFYGSTETLDIINESYSTSVKGTYEEPVANKFADNFSNAFSF